MSPAEEIDLIIQSSPDWRGQLLAELRATILASSPLISEAVKWKMPSKPLGSPTWEHNGIICVADYLKKSVRLTFPKGASIEDPDGLFNSRLDSKVARAIDFFEGEPVNHEGLKRLIQRAE